LFPFGIVECGYLQNMSLYAWRVVPKIWARAHPYLIANFITYHTRLEFADLFIALCIMPLITVMDTHAQLWVSKSGTPTPLYFPHSHSYLCDNCRKCTTHEMLRSEKVFPWNAHIVNNKSEAKKISKRPKKQLPTG